MKSRDITFILLLCGYMRRNDEKGFTRELGVILERTVNKDQDSL